MDIQTEIVFKHPTKEMIFFLDESYKIIEINSDQSLNPIQYQKGQFVKISDNTKFTKLFIKYGSTIKLSNINITPGIYHFPYFSLCSNLNNIKIHINSQCLFTTNAVKTKDGKYQIFDLRDLVIVSNDNNINCTNFCILIQNRKVIVSPSTKKVFSHLNICEEIRKFLNFYYSIFEKPLNIRIMDSHCLNVNAISYKGLILFNPKLLSKPSVLLYKYLFHEIIHQEIGLNTIFYNKGRFLLLESLTEFIQLLYLKERFGETIYSKQIKYSYQLYKNNIEYTKNIPISDYYNINDNFGFLGLICGKGILFFDFLFRKAVIDKDVLKKIITAFKFHKNYISIGIFKNILNNFANIGTDVYFHDWIESTNNEFLNETTYN
ncbi:hypothetical protein [Bacillus sp. SM2101]|uniref:hypothetical protein n=1 Tax=Bacillus sp. SM2101 TaxID=2805366 RepID=UPI001BDE5F61|nr:hypothetical protein [Bacillus sp. SM2101]